MKKNPYNDLDNFFKSSLDNHEIPFEPADWNQMEAMLNQQDNKNQRRWGWWWVPASSIWLLLFLGIGLYVTNAELTDNLITQWHLRGQKPEMSTLLVQGQMHNDKSENGQTVANNKAALSDDSNVGSRNDVGSKGLHQTSNNIYQTATNNASNQFISNADNEANAETTHTAINNKSLSLSATTANATQISISNKKQSNNNQRVDSKSQIYNNALGEQRASTKGKSANNRDSEMPADGKFPKEYIFSNADQNFTEKAGSSNGFSAENEPLLTMKPIWEKRSKLTFEKQLDWEKPQKQVDFAWSIPNWEAGVFGGLGWGPGISTANVKADRPVLTQELGVFVSHKIHPKASVFFTATVFNMANLQGTQSVYRRTYGFGRTDSMYNINLNGTTFINTKIAIERHFRQHAVNIGGSFNLLLMGQGTVENQVVVDGKTTQSLDRTSLNASDGLSQMVLLTEFGYGYRVQPNLQLGAKLQLPFGNIVDSKTWGLSENQRIPMIQFYIRAGLWEK